ncbi:hypothetical protein [Dankookia sp. P2]|uniref:hypothetical protein n=1 Tax=Dankookia sp. P2 TaxID=3423955 RepID=UPI003D672D08
MIGNGFLNPLGYPSPFLTAVGRGVAEGIDERERNLETIEDLRSGSIDVYARLRSLWRQHRDAELGRTTVAEPDVLDDPGAEPTAAGVPLAAAPAAAPVAAASPPRTARPAAVRHHRKLAVRRKTARPVLANYQPARKG